MKRINSILILFVGINLIVSSLSNAQPKLPKESIPLETPDDVKEQIEKLYSLSAIDRAYAAVKLGKMGKRAIPAIPYLIAMLGDSAELFWENKLNRSPTSPGGEAAVALGEIRDSRAVEALIAALKTKDYVLRWKIVDALGEIGDRRAVEPLIALLKDENWAVRFRAAQALGDIGDTRAVEPLIASLNDMGTLVQEHAAKALKKMTGKDFGSEPLKWQKWWEENREGKAR